jgi:hypothetical protein
MIDKALKRKIKSDVSCPFRTISLSKIMPVISARRQTAKMPVELEQLELKIA